MQILSWKIKRTVFRDYASIIQPEEDWSLFNLTQNIKQKVYDLPRTVFEKKEKPQEKRDTIVPVAVEEKLDPIAQNDKERSDPIAQNEEEKSKPAIQEQEKPAVPQQEKLKLAVQEQENQFFKQQEKIKPEETIVQEIVKSTEIKVAPEPMAFELKAPTKAVESSPRVTEPSNEKPSDLPQVVMTQSGDTRHEPAITKRKQSIGSDRE